MKYCHNPNGFTLLVERIYNRVWKPIDDSLPKILLPFWKPFQVALNSQQFAFDSCNEL